MGRKLSRLTLQIPYSLTQPQRIPTPSFQMKLHRSFNRPNWDNFEFRKTAVESVFLGSRLHQSRAYCGTRIALGGA